MSYRGFLRFNCFVGDLAAAAATVFLGLPGFRLLVGGSAEARFFVTFDLASALPAPDFGNFSASLLLVVFLGS
ncbi:MAG TPA: hypothetical protein PKA83_06380, partial [Pirellulaceae bacterium]|nr:hypothetical protein [Pirellulaceae bacterium]